MGMGFSGLARFARFAAVRAGAGVVVAVMLVATDAAAPRFYPDDPIWTDDDRAFDASGVGTIEDSNGYDFVANTFSNPG